MTGGMMITGMSVVSSIAMQSLGWALLHFLWQGTAIAAVAASAMALCRRASTRYLLGVAALALMLLAPLATFFYFEQMRSTAEESASALPRVAAGTTAGYRVAPRTLALHVSLEPSREIFPRLVQTWLAETLLAQAWLVQAWLLGVAFFSLRSAGGFLLLEHERRKQSSVVSPRVLEVCRTLQRRLGLHRAISYCECKWLQAPAVIGWFRPVVFLPITALTGLSDEQLEAVIAHELAHIRRFDPFVNVFQVCVETLLFYHPAIWWLNKKVRAEREHCCDDMAVDLCGNAVEYARALTLMEEWRSAPTFAMAANRGPLTERIVRVLGLKTLGARMRISSIGLTGSVLCLTAALAAGNALLGMAHPRPVQAAQDSQAKPAPAQSPAANGTSTSKPSAAHSQTSESPTGAPSSASSTSSSASSYIDAMKAAGLGDLTVDQLIAMKIQDVTPEYVRALQEQGLHPDVNSLIAMRIQGVTPEYIRGVRASGLNPDTNQLIALKVQGADGEYYRALKEAGIEADVNTLIGLKVQGVTPEYVRELHAAGITATAEQVIALKVQDVSPEYLKGLHEQGIDPRANDAIAMRVQNVTPEYIRDIRALGLQPSANELIAMRVQDVTPEYIKALQAAGFKFGINELISAKVQAVTPELIERARKHGFKDLTLQKLIQLQQLGILDSKADI